MVIELNYLTLCSTYAVLVQVFTKFSDDWAKEKNTKDFIGCTHHKDQNIFLLMFKEFLTHLLAMTSGKAFR